ncbi:lipoprotein-releasing ABC transporter permease subunit [Vogesella sp. XCS3]|uniref:lipoprotein-releasing ABC transporter permease subunit n=1 Tax=Vogesella sp. XCS3 TaxID=2877939 RepID=UPI001D0B6F9A|nr:lipoprotein-releasing ABC transporter permease subunit [Vogesella sp. XCS3]UDM17397.1 lipoprotein-releasing ABC transporter permease subunit [Vogesella sp. XCS3]
MSFPYEVFIGLRYLRARRRNGFISFISLMSVLGIALGVAALIVVLSVMNGFQQEIRGRMLSVVSHLEIGSYDGQIASWQPLQAQLRQQPHVVAAAPYVNAQGLLSSRGNVRGALVRGIDPAAEQTVVALGKEMLRGKLTDLEPGSYRIVLGVELARQLGVEVGDKVTLITPQGNVTPAGMMPRLKQFTVAGVFKAGMFEYDSSLAMISLRDAQVLFRLGQDVSGIRLKLDDTMLAPQVKAALQPQLAANLVATDWTDMNANYFRAVQIEKRMMFIILTLIVAVAAFNLVSTLVMVVTDKQADIAILRTLGASPASIMKIFMIQGSIAGVLGTVAGVAGGLLLAYNLGAVLSAVESLIGAKLLSSDVYMIDYLPTDIQLGDVSTIGLISLALALLATIYPSWRAARVRPAEALRYE